MALNRTLSRLAIAMMALPVILGVSLCYVRPGSIRLWVVAMCCVPAASCIKAIGQAFGKTAVGAMTTWDDYTADGRTVASDSIIVASLVVALPLAATLANALGLIDESLARMIATRWTNALAGGYFVFHGNRLPKILSSDLQYDPTTIQTVRLHTGRVVVLAGLAFTVLWLILPVRLAERIGIAVVVAGVLVPSLRMRVRVKRRVQYTAHGGDETAATMDDSPWH
jgi:hypothetical protein